MEVSAVRPDADALRTLAAHVLRHGQEVTAVIESMTGARFVHDQLELRGWDVAIGDAVKVKGLAPLAAKTDKIDAWVLAELARRDLVPEIWLPTPDVRAERERARFRLHLVRHRTALKNRIHATLISFGHPVPVADLFGVAGRELLARMDVPAPWSETLATSLSMVDELDERIDGCDPGPARTGCRPPRHPAPRDGAGGGLGRGLHDRVRDRRHPALRRAPRSWSGTPDSAPSSASRATAMSAGRSRRTAPSTCAGRSSKRPSTRPATPVTRSATSGRSDGSAASAAPRSPGSTSPVKLAEAIWHVLTKNEPFAPAGPAIALVA